jgi:AraC-like DNA-binding protein
VPRHKRPVAMQRAASLMPLPSLLAELGVSMGSVLEGTGISSSALGPASFIPYSTFLTILDNSAMATGRDDIGMLLGRRQTLTALGPLGKLMRHAATLGEALAEFVAFQINNSTGGAVYLLRADRDVMLGYGVYNPSVRVSHHIYDLVLAVGCNLIAELTGGAVGPEEILVSRAPPSDPAPYRRLGPCPVHFDQNQTGMLLRASALTFRLPEANIVLHREALAELVSALEPSRGELCGHVLHLLRPHLLMGQAKMEDLAGRLGFHPRAMRRRLRQEGTTFEAIKDEVRFTTARELLMLGALGITDIAFTLDYSSVSSFVHAFRRWSGMSPGQWRQTEAWRNAETGRASPALA